MALFVMPNFHGLTLFIWIVCILTLSVKGVVKTDGTTPSTSGLSASSVHVPSKNEHQTLSSPVHFTSESIDSTKTLNNNVTIPLVFGEGGPIPITSAIQDATSVSHLTNISNNLNTPNNILKEEENIPNIESRKNSKIVSRKGANEMLNVKQENDAQIKTLLPNHAKQIVESSSVASIVHNNDKHINHNMNNSKLNISILNNTFNSANVSQEKLSKNITITASSIQEHRPKPTATVVGPNSDKRAFISHTKGLHLGMSKKIDYVLPVIVTLIALPVLGAIIFMVYKQGRDCWDKRHYRRMDFLIDGMYND